MLAPSEARASGWVVGKRAGAATGGRHIRSRWGRPPAAEARRDLDVVLGHNEIRVSTATAHLRARCGGTAQAADLAERERRCLSRPAITKDEGRKEPAPLRGREAPSSFRRRRRRPKGRARRRAAGPGPSALAGGSPSASKAQRAKDRCRTAETPFGGSGRGLGLE